MSILRNPAVSGIGALADFFSLFAGRIGGILVTFVFIPQFSRLLGDDVFGSVAVVLSLQAFFLVSDLGLATLISRDTAIARGNAIALTAVVWMRRRAEAILLILASCVAAIALMIPMLAGAASPWSLSVGANVAMIALLILALIVTNVAQLSLNSLGLYRMSAATAVIGAVVRGAATVAVLRYSPTFSAFLQVQLGVAVIHFAAVRWLVERQCGPLIGREPLLHRDAVLDLLRRCVPLTVYTLASAAAVNLDKTIVSGFISLESAGTYFLATTYALVPVAVLSGPINSYFAPRVAHARHAGDRLVEHRLALIFQLVLMCMVIGPSLGLMFQMADWLNLWMHDATKAARVMEVAPILLAAGALSGTGYYPTTYLIAAGDNDYLARLSLVCGVSVLVAAVIFASRDDLTGLAWSYFAFYAAGFAGLWVRMTCLPGGRPLVRVLIIAYTIPTVVVAVGYWAATRLIGTIVSDVVRLLLPMTIGSVLGMIAAAVVFYIWSRRTAVREPSFGTIQ